MSSSLIAALRRDLVTSSFSVETVGELWGEDAAAALFRGQRLPAIRALRRRRRDGLALSRAETLAALFVLNVPVPRADVDAALPTLGSAGAEQLGLVGPAPAPAAAAAAAAAARASASPVALAARAPAPAAPAPAPTVVAGAPVAKNSEDFEGEPAIGGHAPESSSVSAASTTAPAGSDMRASAATSFADARATAASPPTDSAVPADGTAPDPRTAASGAGATAPETDGAVPADGTAPASETGTTAPETGTTAPETGTTAPDTLATAPDTLVALLDLRPYSFVDTFGAGSWWIASDLGEVALGGRPLDEDHVLGVGGASTTLSGLMINQPVGRVLDLGTGCGIQALHASRHARAVIATDISERALHLARLNAELNAIDNIEFRLGSLFEPVAGERFDQIVSNPPFVITPRREGVPVYEYRDAGFVGDELVATVIRGCEEHLAPGGIAQLLGNWEYRTGTVSAAGSAAPATGATASGAAVSGVGAVSAAGPAAPATGVAASGAAVAGAAAPRAATPAAASGAADGLDRVRDWLQGSSLDAWVIERELQDAPQYAETWIRDGGTRPGTPEFDELYAAWLDDFEARGVSHVGFGYVLLRNNRNNRNSTAGSPPMRRFEELSGARGSNPAGLGQYFQTSLEGYDWQKSKSDEALLASTVTYAPDVTEERHYWPGQENPTVMTLRQGSGFARTVPLGTALAALVGACDGELTIGQICGAIAHLLDVNELELLVDVLPRMRDLLTDGFLLPL
ncbi:methyltransferase [Subtercola endophyticus]|uniref:DUF7059 domain-containing protein n=1 Tax=Subtercola endophyticus TaxID=2895559 RepID=UPI001E29427F|nr:methyltransferase [Subtercola endophyticus]UFS59707.1 methyltransferase [Subtercola endophyticus]